MSIRLDEFGIALDITNTTDPAARPGLPASGYGIAGMRERATLLGGTLTAERQPSGEFLVKACIPLDPEPA